MGPKMSSITPHILPRLANSTRTMTNNLSRADSANSARSDLKHEIDIEDRPVIDTTTREDDDQVGYATFMAAQARGIEPTAQESKRVLRRMTCSFCPSLPSPRSVIFFPAHVVMLSVVRLTFSVPTIH